MKAAVAGIAAEDSHLHGGADDLQRPDAADNIWQVAYG